MRTSEISRRTAETEVRLALNLDGSGISGVDSGVGFLNHMLTLFARHGRFDLSVRCKGDVEVDGHHNVEDTGICLGQAFREALGERRGVRRYASLILPMDEALVLCAVDLSGRSLLCCDLNIPSQKIGTFDTELCEEFLQAFVREAGITLHVRQLAGSNSHHIVEAVFKALGRALRQAVSIDPDSAEEIPSTKGVL